MCGFSGFWSFNDCVSQDYTRVLNDMGEAIRTRGPDSSGVWFDESTKIGLSHRRLAIVDLSEAGHQPMISPSGKFVISFNGEIYNHQSLRAELDQLFTVKWRGHSDTETLLIAIENWGLESTLKKAIGMFGLAVFDVESKQLKLARDRFGEKPLYYGWQNGVFLFGSQLNALRPHPSFKPEINRDAISLLLRHNYIPTPYSIYKDIFKLEAGSIFTLEEDRSFHLETYWSLRDAMSTSHAAADSSATKEQLSSLETTLKQAVSQQMVADVPLGAFLSGGVDSSLVVALMQTQSSIPIKTFSIGFDDPRFNEAEFAKAIANHLGTEHTEFYVNGDDALKVIPKLAEIYDEPFSDSSQIPTYLVSKIASEHVTVSLSGDAGDELFCGYNRYVLTSSLWRKINFVPKIVRSMFSFWIKAVPIKFWNSLSNLIPNRLRPANLGDKLHKAANVLASSDIESLYLGLVSHWHDPDKVVIGAKEPLTALTDPKRKASFRDPILQMMAQDTLSYLQDDILVKVDRAAMAVSLETRVPFLDHRVLEHAWRIPLSLKLNQGSSKWCLRQILYKYVPRSLIERPKMGFAVPLDAWLRGPLVDWANNLLEEERLRKEGFFNVEIIVTMWKEHKSGKRNWQYQLWDVLMFQLWYEKYHK